jgi:hypothetical protein
MYLIKSDVSLDWIHAKLKVKDIEFREQKFDEEVFQLGSVIKMLRWHDDRKAFDGTLAYEILEVAERLDGSIEPFVTTEYVDFCFTEGSTIFIAFSRKDKAETASNILTRWLGPPAFISNISFTPDMIESFLREHEHTLKRIYWSNLVIPGIDRANLDGTNVGPTEDAQRYDELGDKNYITVVLHDEHLTVTISSTGAVGFISKIDREGMLDFLRRNIFPMILF